jgi:hypothetical protein
MDLILSAYIDSVDWLRLSIDWDYLSLIDLIKKLPSHPFNWEWKQIHFVKPYVLFRVLDNWENPEMQLFPVYYTIIEPLRIYLHDLEKYTYNNSVWNSHLSCNQRLLCKTF